MAENLLLRPVPETKNISATETEDSEICWLYNELADIPEEFVVIARSRGVGKDS